MSTSTPEKVTICWASDSQGRITCHLNINRKTLAETYIGEILYSQKEGRWFSILSGSSTTHGPHRDYREAQLHVERSVNGEPVSD